MVIHVYNTLSRKKEVFKPISSKHVGLYSCGPTVYWYQHIGNMRTYLFSDTLRRVLEYNGFKVKHVMNITDVGHLTSDADDGEDKMEKAVAREHKSAEDIAEHYTQEFAKDLEKLNIEPPAIMPTATEHIKEQLELIKKLEEKGYTYRTSDGIYFDSTKFKSYGKLARLHVQGLAQGARVHAAEKHHKTDFALWKFSKNPGVRQQEWPAFGRVGYPGWHIECSAMSMKYLGSHFDIHTGGEDHIPIHHTNEIAQSEAATGKKFVNYWLHGAFLMSKGEKVSKSKGGLYTITELEQLGYDPMHFRYLALLTHYRKPLNFALEHLNAARAAYTRLVRKVSELPEDKIKSSSTGKKFENAFEKAINDDLNMPKAVQVLWRMLDDKKLTAKSKIELVKKFDTVLGLELREQQKDSIPEDIQVLAHERELARKSKDWKRSDALRDELKKRGYQIEDTEYGPRVF